MILSSRPDETWPQVVSAPSAPAFEHLRVALSCLSDTETYNELMLEATLRHACAIPFYERWEGAEFEELPMTTPADLAVGNAQRRFSHPAYPAEFVRLSGGTTSRRRMVISHAWDQLVAVAELAEAELAILATHEDYSPFDGLPYLRLRVDEPVHGPRVPLPKGPLREEMILPLTSDGDVELVLDMLCGRMGNPQSDRPVADLAVGYFQLLLLLAAVEAEPSLLDGSPLERVITGGIGWSLRKREQVESVLGARLVEGYGTSELYRGNCFRCRVCGHFHAGRAVRHEYLETDVDGCVEIVASNYVPFALRTVVLRYKTGDIVRFGPRCDAAGARGFELIGRAADIRMTSGGRVVSHLLIARSLGGLSGICHSGIGESGSHLSAVERTRRELYGVPRFVLRDGPVLVVETWGAPPLKRSSSRHQLLNGISAALERVEDGLSEDLRIELVSEYELGGEARVKS